MIKLSAVSILAAAAPLLAPPIGGQELNRKLVEAYLWPRDATELRGATEALAAGSMESLSRLEMLDLEEWMRAGRSGLESFEPDSDGSVPLQEFEVRAPTGAVVPVTVRLPRGYDPRRQWPLLLAMHGGPTGTAEQARGGAGRMIDVWAASADEAGWIVAAPAMVSTCTKGAYTPERLPYEVFHPEEALAVVASVRERVSVNPDRVVSTGISLGSNFSIAFACAHPDWLSAIVPVSTEGDSRELLLRNLRGVPVYLLEGSQDQNIRAISGPRALREILIEFGDDLQYREFSERSHEGFGEHYGDVLRWLDSRPRRRDPRVVLRVPYGAIVPVARRVHWLESDTRQGLLRGTIAGPHRIEIEAHRARSLRLFLNDHLVDLDQPVTIVVNGETVFEGTLVRSARVALEEARELGDERRFYCAVVRVAVPTDEKALAVGRRLAEEFSPRRVPGTLSFWEMYATRALDERFVSVGFEGVEEELPEVLRMSERVQGEEVGLRVTGVDADGPLAGSGLRAGDLLLEFGGEPFFHDTRAVAGLHDWLVRELRDTPTKYTLKTWRQGKVVPLVARLGLGPYHEPEQDSNDPEGGH